MSNPAPRAAAASKPAPKAPAFAKKDAGKRPLQSGMLQNKKLNAARNTPSTRGR